MDHQVQHAMMNALYLYLSKKINESTLYTPRPPANNTVVRLKDINERNLPSPYYHLEYNASGDITHTSFSGGIAIYDVIYAGKKIARIENRNAPNKDVLEYLYMHDTNTYQLPYNPDGNLKQLALHNYTVGSQTASTITDNFDDYDDKVNVDAFSLLHPDMNHHLYLLPEVTLQLKNPHRVVRTGDGVNYEIDYTYTYDAKSRPVVRSGDVHWTSGPDAGKHFNAQSSFSYYD
jgi:hypothetical protein